MFQAYSAIFATLDILRHICPHLGIFWQIQAYLESCHSQTYLCILRHIQNSWFIQAYSEPYAYLVSSRHVIQVLLNMDSISIIAIITACYLCKHATHATNASMPSFQTHHPSQPRHTRQPATHASTPPTSTMLACFPRKCATHAIHASTSSAPFLKLA